MTRWVTRWRDSLWRRWKLAAVAATPTGRRWATLKTSTWDTERRCADARWAGSFLLSLHSASLFDATFRHWIIVIQGWFFRGPQGQTKRPTGKQTALTIWPQRCWVQVCGDIRGCLQMYFLSSQHKSSFSFTFTSRHSSRYVKFQIQSCLISSCSLNCLLFKLKVPSVLIADTIVIIPSKMLHSEAIRI